MINMTRGYSTDKYDPWVKRLHVKMASPSLKDNTGDADRLIRALKRELEVENIRIPYSLLANLPHKLRELQYDCSVAVYEDANIWNIIDIFPPDGYQQSYGIALDLGSSTLVMRLVNLDKGEVIRELSFRNPQITVGTDILSRIYYATQTGGLEELHSMLLDKINDKIHELCTQLEITPHEILALCVAGNTTMTHFFLGLDPYWICREPYIPVVNSPELILCKDLGVHINEMAPVFALPNVGSYFGGDLIAGILVSGMNHEKEICLLVDVGTNAEVVLGNKDWLMGCAGAAGPALEGGVASMGMMAGPGVIDKVWIDPETGKINYHTIDDLPPVGICGSGLIDLVAHLYLSGMIDLRGKFVPDKCGNRLVEIDGIGHFVVVSAEESATNQPLTLSQPDIDSLIRSKAAMYTILTTITKTVELSLRDISKFFIAGTFGSYIDPRSAIVIGMIPDLPLDTYIPLGNTSVKGATLALISREAREECMGIRDKITYLELNVNQEFMNLFSAAKFIPHTDKTLFPSVKVNESQAIGGA